MTSSPIAPVKITPQTPPPKQLQNSTAAKSTAGAAPAAAATTVTESPSASKVSISAAGLAALQESRETPAQTAAEARHGDRVAKNIVAKHQARAAEFKANSK